MATTAIDPTPGRLSIMAGRGALPVALLAAASAAGWQVQYLSFVDRDDVNPTVLQRIETGKPLEIVLAIRRFKSTHICMVGAVDVSDKGREGFFKFLGRKKGGPSTGGDTSLSKLGKALEFATGANMIGVHDVMPDLLAGEGHIAGPKIAKNSVADGQFALERAIAAGRLDLGQALVCSGRRVVAVEDIGGTDRLLQRICDFRKEGLVGDGASKLVLAKAKKPKQPMFVDLPAIGPDTVRMAQVAGVSAIFVEAGRSLIIDRTQVGADAVATAVSIYGYRVGDD